MFSDMCSHEVQELHFFNQGDLHAVIALHNLKLGPALGGCRFIEYDSEGDAITDAMRLAKGMSYKAALARVPQGGGKAVIMKPKTGFNREQLFKDFGQAVQSLGGRYITAMDSGTSVNDMDSIRSQTLYVSSSSNIGDPSPSTAKGVALGILAATHFKLNSDLHDVRVAIQGLGHVGMALAEHLYKAGAKLIVSDVDSAKTKEAEHRFQAKVVSSDEIYSADCEVFSPCGLGAVINESTLPKLKCQIVAGCANNQLAQDHFAKDLHDSGILYAPDYVINSGGLIFASSRFRELKMAYVDHEIMRLKDTLNQIFVLSKNKNLPCNDIANEMAEHTLYEGGHSLILEAV